MMSIESLMSLAAEIGEQAAADGREPWLMTEDVLADRKAIRGIPNIGNYRPAGWRLVRMMFVDKYGVGTEGGISMGMDEFLGHLRPGFGYAMIEEGQFQCHVGEFVPDDTEEEDRFENLSGGRPRITIEYGKLWEINWSADEAD